MLQAIWYLSNHIEFGNRLPPYLDAANPYPQKDWTRLGFFQWELDTLAREAILHCDAVRGDQVTAWKEVAALLNKLKWTEEQAHEATTENIFAEMSRIAHRQFHWQNGVGHTSFTRLRRMYRYPGMDGVVQDVYGLTTEQVALGGFAALATYMQHFAITPDWPENASNLLQFNCRSLIENLTTDLVPLRQATLNARSLDENWSYTFSPLWLHPLIRIEDGSRIICPIPGLLARRITDGLYFDIAGHDVDALSAYLGPAFQTYMGDVFGRANKGKFRVYPEERYGKKGAPKDTVDWIIEDDTASLFVEVKLLKMGNAAKVYLAPQDAVTNQFKKLAKAIGQVYATLRDATEGQYPSWKPNGKPVHPVIVTMDNWNLFTHTVQGLLDDLVGKELDRRGIERTILQTNRYVVCCANDFEMAIQVMHEVGINAVMKDMTTGDKVGWLFGGHLRSAFPNSLEKVVPLFPEERSTFLANIKQR